jgi:hypothetical protein
MGPHSRFNLDIVNIKVRVTVDLIKALPKPGHDDSSITLTLKEVLLLSSPSFKYTVMV